MQATQNKKSNFLIPQYKEVVTNSVAKADPTKTTTIRKKFASEMGRRFRELAAVIRKAIVEQDCFGLRDDVVTTMQLQAPGFRQFAFTRSADKIDAFMEWLQEQERMGILEITRRQRLGDSIEEAWSNVYIRSSYQKGRAAALGKLGDAGYDVDGKIKERDLAAGFYQPVHADRVGVLYIRTFRELKGITDAMDQQISRVLAQGMAKGENPLRIAKQLNHVITGMGNGATLGIKDTLGRFIPAERRAKILARTEVIRAHHQAHIQEYRNMEVAGVSVVAEWLTAGDSRVCPQCQEIAMAQQYYTVDEVTDMIPVHPQCRCTTVPVPKDVPIKRPKAEEPLFTEYAGIQAFNDLTYAPRVLPEERLVFARKDFMTRTANYWDERLPGYAKRDFLQDIYKQESTVSKYASTSFFELPQTTRSKILRDKFPHVGIELASSEIRQDVVDEIMDFLEKKGQSAYSLSAIKDELVDHLAKEYKIYSILGSDLEKLFRGMAQDKLVKIDFVKNLDNIFVDKRIFDRRRVGLKARALEEFLEQEKFGAIDVGDRPITERFRMARIDMMAGYHSPLTKIEEMKVIDSKINKLADLADDYTSEWSKMISKMDTAERHEEYRRILTVEGGFRVKGKEWFKLSNKNKKAFAQALDDSVAGVSHIKPELFRRMQLSGYKMDWTDKNIRASYSGYSKNVSNLTIYEKNGMRSNDYIVVAHETSHGIDAFHNGITRYANGSSGEKWLGVNGFLTEKDTMNFRKWYADTKTSGTIKVGPKEVLEKGNWISAYEGRKYAGSSVGEEFWTMNTQRYADYLLLQNNKQIMQPILDTMDTVVDILDKNEGPELIRTLLSKEKPSQTIMAKINRAIMAAKKSNGADLLSLGLDPEIITKRDIWRSFIITKDKKGAFDTVQEKIAAALSNWDKVKTKHPDFAKLIQNSGVFEQKSFLGSDWEGFKSLNRSQGGI